MLLGFESDDGDIFVKLIRTRIAASRVTSFIVAVPVTVAVPMAVAMSKRVLVRVVIMNFSTAMCMSVRMAIVAGRLNGR